MWSWSSEGLRRAWCPLDSGVDEIDAGSSRAIDAGDDLLTRVDVKEA